VRCRPVGATDEDDDRPTMPPTAGERATIPTTRSYAPLRSRTFCRKQACLAGESLKDRREMMMTANMELKANIISTPIQQ